jgi:hypothetical protein
MMDLTWYFLGVLTGGALYCAYVLANRFKLNWLLLSGVGTGAGLLLFSIAWGVGAVLEGVPRAGSMGILLFGLPGLILLTVTLRHILSQKEVVR